MVIGWLLIASGLLFLLYAAFGPVRIRFRRRRRA